MWFETLMGFEEKNHEQVQNNIILDDETITSKINGKTPLDIRIVSYERFNPIINSIIKRV